MTTDTAKTLAATFDWKEIRAVSSPSWAMARLAIYWRTRGTRRNLAELSDDQLRDIGVPRTEARKELGKSWYWS